MISEEKMLLIALASMYIASFAVAVGLYLAGAGPLAVVLVGTTIGALIYIAICKHYAPSVQQYVEVDIEEERDNA